MSIDSPQVSPAVWPYAYRRLYEVPDLATIEEHAVGHRTALNVGRVTAFVGSGVSMAYGRITWADLIATIQKSVLRDAQRTEVRKTWREPRSGDKLNTLVKLLGELADESRLRRPAQQLTVFELAEQLDGLVHTRRSPHGDEPSPFLRRIMQLTEDERGYLRQLLEDALDDGQTLAAVDGELAKQLQRLDKMLDRSGTKWL